MLKYTKQFIMIDTKEISVTSRMSRKSQNIKYITTFVNESPVNTNEIM